MIKILLTGANGQVGHEIVNFSKSLKLKLYAFTHNQLDITNFEEIKRALTAIRPNFIINTAAYTAVDKAEVESELAFLVNALGVKYLAQLAQKYDIPLLHISTDYIFDGQKKMAYTEDDEARPLSSRSEER